MIAQSIGRLHLESDISERSNIVEVFLNGEFLKEKVMLLKQFNKGNMEIIVTNVLNDTYPTNHYVLLHYLKSQVVCLVLSS